MLSMDTPPDSFVARTASCVAGNPYEARMGWDEVRSFVENWLEKDEHVTAACEFLAPHRGDPQFLQRILETPLMLGAFCHRIERWGPPRRSIRTTPLLVETVTAWLLYTQSTIYSDSVYAETPKLSLYKSLANIESFYYESQVISIQWQKIYASETPNNLLFDMLCHGLIRPETDVDELHSEARLAYYLSATTLYEVLPLLNDLPEIMARS